MKKFSSWFMGNQPGKQQKQVQSGRPKKNVHWKSAERPSPPGRPILIPQSDQQPDVVTLKWERPKLDGGSPITGYIIEHRRMGSPHWVRSTASEVTGCEVSISGLEPGWRYQFRAIAENVVGKSDPSELSDPLTVTLQRNAISVPRFVSELADLSVVENERIEFRVSVLGQPPPEISWFKDGYEIFSSRRTKIVNDNDVSVLIIHQVALTDEGEIKCTATNRAGHVVTKAKLMVEAPPKIRLPRNYEDGLIVEADEVLRLKVGIAGQPPPSVVWLHEGEPLPDGGRHELVNTDKNSSLKIDNVKRIDRGEYSIRASNKLGEDSASFLVTVTSKPYPPGKVRLNTSYGKSATLSWTAPEDDGGCKIGNYIVEYFRIGWNVWLKAATTRQLSTTLNDLIEGSEYKFRVKAENPYGISDPGEESDVLSIPDLKRDIKKSNGEEKPIPPRRKTLSPQRALPEGEEASGNTSPRQVSPMLARKTKPQILDNEDLHREMSYGTNLTEANRTPPSTSSIEVPTVGSFRRSPSPRKPHVEEKNNVVSVSTSTTKPAIGPLTIPTTLPVNLPIRPLSPSTTAPVIGPALGPVLTSVLAPVLRFSPTTPTTPPPLPTPPSPRLPTTQREPIPDLPPKKLLSKQTTVQQKEEPPTKPIVPQPSSEKPAPIVRMRSLSPLECSEPSPPVAPTSTEPPVPLRNRSLSPVEQLVNSTPPKSPTGPKKRSPALQRSEEPVKLDVNQRVQRYSDSPDVERQPSHNGTPTIHVSGPGSDPVPSSDAEKRDEVHTSNEFMLVLFHKNSKVKDKEKQDSFDLDIIEALQPPPISISSPDLASLEFTHLHTFPLRRSVSSTELLYERAMARFYEAVEMEEAEKAKKIKVSKEKLPVQPTTVRKRLGSMSEAERLSFEKRSEMRRRSADIGDSSNIKWDSRDNITSMRPLARTREMLNQQFRQDSQETDEASDYLKTGESFDVESDYTASTDSVSEDSIENFKRELAARTRSTSNELETYHPRSMAAGVFTPYRAPTPEQSVIVLNRPVPLASPDFVPKPILKRPSNENVVSDESLFPVPAPSSPAPSSPAPSSPAPSSPPPSAPAPNSPILPLSPNNDKTDKSKGFKSFFKWDKKSPTEKNTEANSEPPKAKLETKVSLDLETKRKIKEEEERQKLEAERIFQEEARVAVDHYSDIVRQVGTTKKYNPPLYLNRDELKKAAEKAAQEGILDDYMDDYIPSGTRMGKPRLSLVERHQIQHVHTSSRLAKTITEKPKIPDTPSEDETAQPSASQPSQTSAPSQRSESRGRTKIIKVKKIVKKRVPSATRSRDPSNNRPPSSVGASSDDIGRRQSATELAPVRKELPTFIPPPLLVSAPSVALVAVHQKTPEELAQEAEEKVRSAFSYVTDVCLFIAACYVYLFKDARLVLPILALMVYRQLGEVIRNNIPDWVKKKRQ